MFATVLVFAAEVEEKSLAPFYIAASALVGFALILSAIGIARHGTFPPSRGVANALILVCAILVVTTAYTAVITG